MRSLTDCLRAEHLDAENAEPCRKLVAKLGPGDAASPCTWSPIRTPARSRTATDACLPTSRPPAATSGRPRLHAGWTTVYRFHARRFSRLDAYERAGEQARAAQRGVWHACRGDFHASDGA